MNIWEEILLSLKIRIPSKFIFAALGIIQAAVIYLTGKEILPEFIYKIHTDKVIITYSMLVMICYNGKRKFRLLFQSLIGCMLIFIPLSSLNHIEFNLEEVSHISSNYFMIYMLYPIVFSICYYYQNYGIRFSNIGNQAYLSFWTPITKLLMTIFYFITSTLVILIFAFLIKIVGLDYFWNDVIDVEVIKVYIPLALSFFLWIIYKHPDISGNVIRGMAYMAHNLYKLIAPLGILLLLSDIISSFMMGKISPMDYRALFSVTLFSVLIFHLSNYPDENNARSHPMIEKAILVYNLLLPYLPITFLIHLLTNFYEDSGDLICNQSILKTGIHWGNFAPTLGVICLIYLSVIQAYYSYKKEKMEQRLAVDSWWICLFYSAVCVLAFNPLFDLNPHKMHYFENCHHFKEVNYNNNFNLKLDNNKQILMA